MGTKSYNFDATAVFYPALNIVVVLYELVLLGVFYAGCCCLVLVGSD